MSKRKWRRGSPILSLDELVRQSVVFWGDKPVSRGWFMSWQISMGKKYSGPRGLIAYAIPYGISTRFTDAEIIRAERRLKTKPDYEGRKELMQLLNRFDRGSGDVDDIVDDIEAQTLKGW